MGFFSGFLKKLGFGDDKPAAAASGGAETSPPVIESRIPEAGRPTKPPQTKMPEVDVVGKLEDMARGKNLNWRTSIVDLMKVLDMDSSLPNRKALAAELGCPQEKMGDSAAMNIWLHKEVMKQLAANGGNIPKELLD